jgi:hypothetical protein
MPGGVGELHALVAAHVEQSGEVAVGVETDRGLLAAATLGLWSLALHRIVVARLRHDQQTKDYLARRIREGTSKKEAIRCLKRYAAREVFAVLPR